MARTVSEDGPHPVDLHVGRRVVERRTALGFNQSQLAAALDLTFQQIQKYEKGANRISSSKLYDISQFLGVDIGYFFVGLGSERASAREAGANDDAAHPPTRQSLEIARLAPRLTLAQQKLALELMRDMAGQGAWAET